MDAPRETVEGTWEKARVVSCGALTAVALALMVSVTLNVLLGHRLQTLNRARSARRAELLLKIGTTVPPILAKRLGAPHEEVISYQGVNQPTVLYVFTPPCSWCERNLDNFRTLFEEERGQYRFIALSLSKEGLAEYVTRNELKLSVYSGVSTETKEAYKLGGTPQTIVISPDGRVLQNWMGAYVGEQKTQVETFFRVTLPGLRELPKAQGQTN
jgi:peroxiredoxin